jgi:Xaa-Pro aminopeptidase
MYLASRGSTLMRSPMFTKSGTWTTAPVSSVAGFVTFETVSPFTPGSVSVTASSTEAGIWIPDGFPLTCRICTVGGYASDCTRTFFTGEPAGRLRDLYDLCHQAQLDGLAAVRAGATGREVDAASRVAIAEAGMADLYGHGLGHGIGLDVHELPNLRFESEAVLEPGNVVTVEPGLYVAGEAGVRIEDTVVVTEDGCERLTTVTKEPVQVG